jgi:WD40 repeat protein
MVGNSKRIAWSVMSALFIVAGAAQGQEKADAVLPVREIRALQGGYVTPVFSHDSRLLAIGSCSVVGVWNVEDGKLITRVQLPKKQQYAPHVIFGKDDTSLIVCPYVYDPMIRSFDLKTGKQKGEFPHPRSWAHVLAFSPDSGLMALAARDWVMGLDIYDLAARKIVVQLGVRGRVGAARFSRDGKLLVTHGVQGGAQVWDATTGKLIKQFHQKGENPARASAIDISPDGKHLAYPLREEVLSVWSVQTGKIAYTLNTRRPEFHIERPATILFFAPDGQSLLHLPIYSDGPVLHNLVAEKDTCIFQYSAAAKGNWGEATWAVFSPDGKRVAVVAPASSGGSLDSQNGLRSVYLFDIPAKAFDPKAAHFDDAPLEKLWQNLTSANDLRVRMVMQAFRSAPKPAVALIGKHVHPIDKKRQAAVEEVLANTDHEAFQGKFAELRKRELYQFLPLLKAKLKQTKPGPVYDIVESAIDEIYAATPPPPLMLELRCVKLLEDMATKEARALLNRLGEGAPGARVTVEARAAIARLDKKNK